MILERDRPRTVNFYVGCCGFIWSILFGSELGFFGKSFSEAPHPIFYLFLKKYIGSMSHNTL